MEKETEGVLQTLHTNNRNFNYLQDGVRLNFSLRTDIKEELKTFLVLLEKAIIEVREELEKVEKNNG